jgi:hypothetical protein
MYYALLRIFHRLRIQFLLASKRKGRNLISVPVPVRRNKRDVLNIQTLYKAVTSRRERAAPAATSFIGQFILMLPLIATLTPLLNFLLMAIFGRLVN